MRRRDRPTWSTRSTIAVSAGLEWIDPHVAKHDAGAVVHIQFTDLGRAAGHRGHTAEAAVWGNDTG
ncbi:hypothetical protein [Pseudonocardia parietis]|uniref:Uncharacterized protein n=1 Tax=Pseudonocardia parietis TaxID=570936 RepID=A0ABS4W7R5_9PSEU|nr:hypothetical protein [Pseudonocardia parietis]MBP2371679.1 hypothetical protein [Pseudonocardia parietis]